MSEDAIHNLTPASSAPDPTSQGEPAGAFLQHFAEALPLLGRYFIVIYPIFLFHIVASLLFPRALPTQAQVLPWTLVIVGLALAQFIFEAGWHAMMFSAIREWLKTKAQSPNTAEESELTVQSVIPYGLLKAFFPGMGTYGLAFLVGGVVWTLLGLVPLAVFLGVGLGQIGLPPAFQLMQAEAMKGVTLTEPQLMAMVTHMADAEKLQWTQWSLLMIGCLGLWVVIQMLTQYWRSFVFVYQCNGAKALWHSVVYAVKHPFKTLSLSVVFTTVVGACLLLNVIHPVAALFGNFFLLLNTVYFGLLLYVVLLTSADVRPVTLPDDETA